MIIKKHGKKYNFEINSQPEGRDFSFFIKAKSKTSRRFSYINNLNAILSEFEIKEEDQRIEDSTWEVTKNESISLISTAIEFLSSDSFLDYLERQLDEDRLLGEWENTL